MLVVDTSAVLAALLGSPRSEAIVRRLIDDGDLHAPHLIDLEVVHALRRLVRSRQITSDRAFDVRFDFANLLIVRYPHLPLADRIWELTGTLTAYDAAFVALSEALAVPLITCDARLARAGGYEARVELFATPERRG